MMSNDEWSLFDDFQNRIASYAIVEQVGVDPEIVRNAFGDPGAKNHVQAPTYVRRSLDHPSCTLYSSGSFCFAMATSLSNAMTLSLVDDRDARFTYSDGWYIGGSGSEVDSTTHGSNVSGSTAVLTFNGMIFKPLLCLRYHADGDSRYLSYTLWYRRACWTHLVILH